MFVTSTSGGSATVRVEWDPPVDNGGAPITSYQILVNSSAVAMKITVNSPQQCYATIALNSTGVYLVEVQASNCAGISSSAAILIGKYMKSFTYITRYIVAMITINRSQIFRNYLFRSIYY